MKPPRESSCRILRQAVLGASRTVLTLASCFWILAYLPAHAILDANSNGLSDLWEKHYNNGALFAATFDPQADPDGDGWSNFTEAISGTDPRNSADFTGFVRPTILHIPAVYEADENGEPVIFSPEAITITWPTLLGKKYTLLSSTDLAAASWSPVGEPEIASGEEMSIDIVLTQPDGSSPPALFLRVAIDDADTDGEGLTDHEENQLGSDPHSADSDQDEVNDLAEAEIGTNPNIPRIWGFREANNSDGTVTYSWNSYAESGDWFQIESKQQNGTWKTIYSTTYGSAKLPYEPYVTSYILTLDPAVDYLP
jgi:Bacterial TSP3 repeat